VVPGKCLADYDEKIIFGLHHGALMVPLETHKALHAMSI